MKVLIKNNTVHSIYPNNISDEDVLGDFKDKNVKIYKVSNQIDLLGSIPPTTSALVDNTLNRMNQKSSVYAKEIKGTIQKNYKMMTLEAVKKADVDYARR